MKKTTSIIIAMLLCVITAGAEEVTLYEGAFTIASYDGIKIEASQFSDLQKGDVIKATGTFESGDVWRFLEFQDGEGTKLETTERFEPNNANIVGASLIVSEAMAATIREKGFKLVGDKFLLAKLVLDKQPEEQVVLYGPIAMSDDGGGGFRFPSALNNQLAGAEAGDKLVFYVSNKGDNAQACVQKTDWGTAYDPAVNYSSIEGDHFQITLTDEIISDMLTNGWLIRGKQYTLDRLTIKKPQPVVIPEEETIWVKPDDNIVNGKTMDGVYGNWLDFKVAKDLFETLQEGDVLTFYTSENHNGQLTLIADMTNIATVNVYQANINSTGTQFGVITTNDAYTVGTRDIKWVEVLQTFGLKLNFHGIVIDKITIKHQPEYRKFFYGPKDISGNVSLDGNYCKFFLNSAKPGDVMTVHVSNVGESAQGAFQTYSGWSSFDNKDAYNYFNFSGDSYCMTLTQAVIDKMKADGFRVRGNGGYTVDAISLSTTAKEYETITLGDDIVTYSNKYKMLDFSAVEDLEAYAAKVDLDEAVVRTTQVSRTAEAEGLILMGTSGKSYQVPVCGENDTFENDLQPVSYHDVVSGFFLGTTSAKGLGFYHISNYQFPTSDKAYIPDTAAPGRQALRLDLDGGDATGIAAAAEAADDGQTAVYDLLGRKVTASQSQLKKGIYVAGGRKYIVK